MHAYLPCQQRQTQNLKYLLKMKKITFILFALIAGTGFAQTSDSDTGTATVNAEIVSPISITDGSDLNFGRIIGNAAGGDVEIDFADVRTFTNADMDVPTTTNLPTTASFDITAALSYKYSISIPVTTLTGAGTDMGIVFTQDRLSTANVGSGAVQALNVGGVLTVNPAQAEGAYTGTVTVT